MITRVKARSPSSYAFHPFSFYTRALSNILGPTTFRDDDDDQGVKMFRTMNHHVSSMVKNNLIIIPSSCMIQQYHHHYHRTRTLSTLVSQQQSLRTFSHIAISDEVHAKKEGIEESENLDDKVSRKSQLKSAATKGSIAVRKGAMSLREILKKYGWTFAGTYFSIWVITLSIVFGSIDSGYIDPVTLTDKIHIIWSNIGDFMGMTHPNNIADPNTTTDVLLTSNTTTENPMTKENDSNVERSSAQNTVDMLASKLELWERTAPYATIVRENPHVGNFAIAVVITKLTEVVRIPLALAIVPKISKALGQKIEEDDDDEEVNKVDGTKYDGKKD